MTQLADIVQDLRRGNKIHARRLLVAHLREKPDHVEAWYVLSYLVDTYEHQVRALTRVLSLEPQHARARARLHTLEQERAATTDDDKVLAAKWGEPKAASPMMTQPCYSSDGKKEVPSTTKVRVPSSDAKAPVAVEENDLDPCETEADSEELLLDLGVVTLFLNDLQQEPIVSNKNQQFWLGAHLQAPTRLKQCCKDADIAVLSTQVASFYALLEEICDKSELNVPRVEGWIAELREARANIYKIKRSRVRRFLRRARAGLDEESIAGVEESVYGFVELLSILPTSTLQRLAQHLREHTLFPTAEQIEKWLIAEGAKGNLKNDVARRWERARQTLAAGYLRYAIRVARNYVGHGVALADLIQEGYLGLFRGASKYNYRDYEQFGHYGISWVWQRVTRAIATQSRTVRLPVHLDERIKRIEKFAQEQDKGHRPLAEEPKLMAALDLIEKQEAGELEEALTAGAQLPARLEKNYRRARKKIESWQALNQPTLSLDRPAPTLPEEHYCDGEWVEHTGDFLVDQSIALPEEIAHRNSLRIQLSQLLERATRGERDLQILRRRYGLDNGEERTLQEVGDEFGLSRERIRQIEARALEIIERISHLEETIIADFDNSWANNLSWRQPPLPCAIDMPGDEDDGVEAVRLDALDKLIDELPRSSWGRWGRSRTREEQLADALRTLAAPSHYQDIYEQAVEEDEDTRLSRSSAYQVLQYGEEIFVPLGEGHFSLVEWEIERSQQPRPVLPVCPMPLPDPPDYEGSFFEATLVAHRKLRETSLTAERLLGEMLLWAQSEEAVSRWKKQSYLSAFYAVGLIPYVFYFGEEKHQLHSELPELSIKELRAYCLRTLTERVIAMPVFWWLLSQRSPARPSELGETLADLHPYQLDDAQTRLYLLASLGAVRRTPYGRYELTSFGADLAWLLGRRQGEMYRHENESDDVDDVITRDFDLDSMAVW